jgi:hypothetical protein
MEEDKSTNLDIALPGEWALRKAFGPVLGEMGEDLKRLYASGRDRILAKAYEKVEDPEDGKQANLRVTRDALWNGAFADNEICAEYFGGIMASSRSENGKDDSAIQFIDVTKSLSSKQLRLHYVIYNRLNKLWVSSGTRVSIGLGAEIERKEVCFASLELYDRLELSIDTDLNILHRHGLLSHYTVKPHTMGGKTLPYASAQPTTFGVLLYASAHNRIHEWREFDRIDFGDFDGIELPQIYCESLEALAEHLGLPNAANVEEPEATEGNSEENPNATT